ncbi:Zn-dependent alcohol dehydrogenase [Nakamurella sp. UYEF19]|uniref:alcohol dehydrogenase catalytic domain-containing protein n=1 Tax=Nakamurella sp. UYEF19 TaxID=1756392 RepID=UPI0033927CC3
MRSSAAVADGLGGFAVSVIDLDDPGPQEVLVELKAAGVCHTDLDVMAGAASPVVLGHEGAGVVRAIGADVHHVEVGQPVLLTWAIACGSCFACVRGNQVLCESLGLDRGYAHAGATRSLGGHGLPRSFHLGTHSAATVVRREAVVPLPKSVPFASAALLGCAVMTGYGSVVNVAKVHPGASVTVIGCGGVGLNVIQAARISGATRIVAVDTNPGRFALANRLGATDNVLVGPDDPFLRRTATEVAALFAGRGTDYAFECTARPMVGAAPLAFVRNGGTAVQVSGIEQEIPFDMALFEWDKVYINPLYGKCRPSVDFPALFALYENGQLLLDELITHTYELDDLSKAFEDMRSGRSAKGVVML